MYADFMAAKARAKELPRRCPACKDCKECQFRLDSLLFKENTEYRKMLNKLQLDMSRINGLLQAHSRPTLKNY
jgi:hypothetical protein